MKRLLKILRYVCGLIFDVLGIAGAPDDASTWNAWVRDLVPIITEPWVFVPLIMIGTSLIMFGVAEAYTRYRVDQERGDDPLLMERDMPLRELFRYLYSVAQWRRDIDDFSEWIQEAALEIRSEARLGRLVVWGRPPGDLADELMGERTPPVVIKPDSWAELQLEIMSIVVPEPAKARTWKFDHVKEFYRDLMANRSQVRRKWPPRLTRWFNRRKWPDD